MKSPASEDIKWHRQYLLGVYCLSYYLYNTSGIVFAKDMASENAHPNYLNEKATLWAESPARALGSLDEEHFAKIANIAFERYGDEAGMRATLASLKLDPPPTG